MGKLFSGREVGRVFAHFSKGCARLFVSLVSFSNSFSNGCVAVSLFSFCNACVVVSSLYPPELVPSEVVRI